MARYCADSPKSGVRSDFERDRARVLHASALRRLGAKTQVLGPSKDDYVRTRLTHSLEVAQVGRQLGKMLGANPDLVDTACLCHDLGHPPYGHNGEKALAQVAKDIGGFEGNAQTFRLLTRLEPKVLTSEGEPVGLNLTRATLDATIKYPWALGEDPNGSHKFGYYPDDQQMFAWARRDSVGIRKSLEAQIMDLSDDIGYSVHDVEDGVSIHALPLESVRDESQWEAIFATTQAWYGTNISTDELGNALSRLIAQDWWLASFDGGYADLARLKNCSSELIGRFVLACTAATREEYGESALGRYSAQVIVPPQVLAEITILKGLASHFVMVPREHEFDYLQQRTLLYDLADVLYEKGPSLLEPLFAAQWEAAEDDAGKLRAVVDQLASLTDNSARAWHARYCGFFSDRVELDTDHDR
nr:deoxyguanosinetriphosphate triphosphohydrolase [Boudabousia tangfeifanii]